MVDLAHRSGDRQHDMKSDKRRAQLSVARLLLERYTMLLLTSAKTLLRHPENQSARKCRDGAFHQVGVDFLYIGFGGRGFRVLQDFTIFSVFVQF